MKSGKANLAGTSTGAVSLGSFCLAGGRKTLRLTRPGFVIVPLFLTAFQEARGAVSQVSAL